MMLSTMRSSSSLPPSRSQMMPSLLSNTTAAAHRSKDSRRRLDNEEEKMIANDLYANNKKLYTTSLHWSNPMSKMIEKHPIDLPNGVDHIQDVEWANTGPAEIHSCANGSSSNLSNYQSTDSTVSKLEIAPRPKPIYPDACFCGPNINSQRKCCTDTSCVLFACYEECGTKCPAGPRCGNKRIRRKKWKQLSVFDAGLKGRGLMTQEKGAPGDLIVEYVGVAVKKQYLDGLPSRYKNEKMPYIMALNKGVYLDTHHRGGIARYINHSCEPNCVVQQWKVNGIPRLGVFALRYIEVGEELSLDYQWQFCLDRPPTTCYCGANSCKGTVETLPKTSLEPEGIFIRRSKQDKYTQQEIRRLARGGAAKARIRSQRLKKMLAKNKEIASLRDELVLKDKTIASKDAELVSLKEALEKTKGKEDKDSISPLNRCIEEDQTRPNQLNLQLDYDHIHCSICKQKYSTDLDSNVERIRNYLPALSSSKTCDHYFCHGCILKQQAAIAEENSGRVPKWIPCMICKTKTAFQPSEPKYHRLLIDILKKAEWVDAPQVKEESD